MFEKVLSFFRGQGNSNDYREMPFRDLPKDQRGKRIKEIFSAIPVLETRRLLLRRIQISDYSDMYEYSSDPAVTKYLTWHPHKTIEETREYAEYLQKRYNDGKFFDWGIEYKDSRRIIGTCGFTTINISNNQAEVGYVLSQRYWGQGIVPEALGAVLDFGFIQLGFDKIDARFLDGNDKSRRVMQKIGMDFDTVLYNAMSIKGEYKTVHTYSLKREKYIELTENLQEDEKPDS